MISTVSLLSVLLKGVHLSHVNIGTRLLNAVQEKVTNSPIVAVTLLRRCSCIIGFPWTGAGENDLPSSGPPEINE
jgi:hypothetical protein